MDDTKREELEKAYKREKDHKVWARMLAVRTVWVIDTVGTAPLRCAADGCESLWIRLIMWHFRFHAHDAS